MVGEIFNAIYNTPEVIPTSTSGNMLMVPGPTM